MNVPQVLLVLEIEKKNYVDSENGWINPYQVISNRYNRNFLTLAIQ